MKKYLTKRTIAAIVFGFSSMAICSAYAADKISSSKPEKPAENEVIYSTPHDNIVQRFKNDQIDVEYHYIKGNLNGIKLLNTGKQSVQIDVLHEEYILGPKDYVLINIPNVKHIIIHHYPDTVQKTTVGKLLPNRFGQHYIYNLPGKTRSNMTTKSTHPANQNY